MTRIFIPAAALAVLLAGCASSRLDDRVLKLEDTV